MSRQLRVNGGIGYRLIWGAYGMNQPLQGATVNVGVAVGDWEGRRRP